MCLFVAGAHMVRDIYEATLPSANMFSISLLKYGEVRRHLVTTHYEKCILKPIKVQYQIKTNSMRERNKGSDRIYVLGVGGSLSEEAKISKWKNFRRPPHPPAIGEKF